MTRMRNIVSLPASSAAAWMEAARVLLEHIVDVLHARDLPLADGVYPFVQPADGRPERDAVMAHLSLLLERLERAPDRVVIHLLHADVVELQKVDAVRPQPLQRRIGGAHQRLGREILRDLPLPASRAPRRDGRNRSRSSWR